MSAAVVESATTGVASGATVSTAVLSTSVAVSAGFEEQAAATANTTTAKIDAILIFIVKWLKFPLHTESPPRSPNIFQDLKSFFHGLPWRLVCIKSTL